MTFIDQWGLIFIGAGVVLAFAPFLLSAAGSDVVPQVLAFLLAGAAVIVLLLDKTAASFPLAGAIWIGAMISGAAAFIGNAIRRSSRSHAARLLTLDQNGLPPVKPRD